MHACLWGKYLNKLEKHVAESIFIKDTINPLEMFVEKRQFVSQNNQ